MRLTQPELRKAIRLNPTYARRLEWLPRFAAIAHVLGFTDRSPGSDEFAQRIADWQRTNGLQPDGIIGPNTWRNLEPRTRMSLDPSTFPPPRWLRTTTAQQAGRAPVVDEALLRRLGYELAEPPISAETLRAHLGPDVLTVVEALEGVNVHKRVLVIRRHNGEGIILELNQGRLQPLTYAPRQSFKLFYKVGDIILVKELSEHQIMSLYSTSFPPRSATLEDVALGFLGVMPSSYKVGHVIDSIDVRGRRATIRGHVVLILSDETDQELVALDLENERRSWIEGNDLNQAFVLVHQARSWDRLQPWLEFIAELAGIAVGSIGRAAGKRVARFTLRGALRRVSGRISLRAAARLIRSARIRIATATVKFCVAFYRTLAMDRRRLEFLRTIDIQNRIQAREYLEPAITAGVSAFVKEIMFGRAANSMNKSQLNVVGDFLKEQLLTTSLNLVSAAAQSALRHASNPNAPSGVVDEYRFKNKLKEELIDVLKRSFEAAMNHA